MTRLFTTLFVLMVFLASSAFARNVRVIKKANQFVPNQLNKRVKLIRPQEKIIPNSTVKVNNAVPKSGFVTPTKSRMVLNKNLAASTYAVQIDSSKNGYGWLDTGMRSVSRFKGVDAASSENIDVLLTAYRQAIPGDDATGHVGAHEIYVQNGLASATFYRAQQLEGTMEGIGARYTGAVALDQPFVFFNWYRDGDNSSTPAFSHPYLFVDWNGGYTQDGTFDWSAPDWQMDDGWLHPDLDAITDPFYPSGWKENRLWDGPTAVVKNPTSGEYQYASTLAEWVLDGETTQWGLRNDVVNLAAHYDATPGLEEMFYEWDDGNDPVIWNPEDVQTGWRCIDMNSSGFGIIATAGILNYPPDSSLYYDTLNVTYATTNDYGVTWSAPDTISYTTLGIPYYVHAADSIITYWEVVGEDTVLRSYEGPTEIWLGDMDAIVDDNNNMYIAFEIFWGRPSDAHGIIVDDDYSGQWIAVYNQDSAKWKGAWISELNGTHVGDEYFPDRFIYFWGSEIDLSMDESGNIYAVWWDRRRTGIQLGTHPRYVGYDDGTDNRDYKTDAYVALSLDGGFHWTDSRNITDSPSIDEYELNVAKSADTRNDATIWFGFSIADSSKGDSLADAYVDLTNQVWIAEASGYFSPSNLDDNSGQAVRSYGLAQNYPNPFNPTTTIEFIPRASGKAHLTVYNSAGQKVKQVFNRYVAQGKKYRVNFDGSNLASGVYFYTLKVADKIETRKMVLLK